VAISIRRSLLFQNKNLSKNIEPIKRRVDSLRVNRNMIKMMAMDIIVAMMMMSLMIINHSTRRKTMEKVKVKSMEEIMKEKIEVVEKEEEEVVSEVEIEGTEVQVEEAVEVVVITNEIDKEEVEWSI
jgi:hypothetical protein